MIATKTGTIAPAFALCVSLLLTAYLTLSTRPAERISSGYARAPLAPRQQAAAVEPVSMASVSRGLVADADLSLLRDDLRAAGASDTTVREVLFGILRRRYREGFSAKRISRIEQGWWR